MHSILYMDGACIYWALSGRQSLICFCTWENLTKRETDNNGNNHLLSPPPTTEKLTPGAPPSTDQPSSPTMTPTSEVRKELRRLLDEEM